MPSRHSTTSCSSFSSLPSSSSFPSSSFRCSVVLLSFLVLSLLSGCSSFYLPGVAPNDYDDLQSINVKVIKLDSVKTQLPYDYYSLPFCRPVREIKQEEENLGEVLSGDQIETSPYTVSMKQQETCKVLCVKEYSAEELQQFADKIEEEYRVNWLLDNIPAATKYYTVSVSAAGDSEKQLQSEPIEHYEKGYALGFVGHTDFPNSKPGVKYINNHLRLNIKFHHEDIPQLASSMSQTLTATADGSLPGATETAASPTTLQSSAKARIVGFEIEAYSVHHVVDKDFTFTPETKPSDLQDKLVTCRQDNADTKPQPVSDFEKDEDKRIIFTYDVQWEKSDIKCQPP